ncbi:MAG TPA: hypothetical protein VK471_05625 [Solirubrobacterales bacterium]|nr:hypothetical protein [Solirubrobacterales bacterium]
MSAAHLAEPVREAHRRLARSWESTRNVWRDSRARDFENRFQAELESTTMRFERSCDRASRAIGTALRDLPS